MSRCPFCGFPERLDGSVIPAVRVPYEWACGSFKRGQLPWQSRECEAYCEGRDDGRRLGHLEALREVQECLDRTPGVHRTEGLVSHCRRRLARRRRMG